MFQSARFKLTAWYLLIIMVVTIVFSGVIYRFLSLEIDRFDLIQRVRIEREFHEAFIPSPNESLVEEAKQRVLLRLLLLDTCIFVLAGGLGYLLAGKTLRPIQKMVDEQQQFISDASHELRTPLTSLKTAFEVYLRGKHQTVPEANILVKESIVEVNALQNLSDSLLQLTQHEQLSHTNKLEVISVTDSLKNALHRVDPMMKEKQIMVSLVAEPARVRGDRQSLTDVFVILLDNAMKYSPKQETLSISVLLAGDTVEIAFTDHGIGINKKDLPHIFDRFYRADSARTTSQTKGYGLGLSIAKNIIHAHHGSIEVQSAIKKGSTFTVHLPKA